jgi:hypothetical protein
MAFRIGWIALLALACVAPTASAHGALAVNELETYAISDFEGQEDSFPWEGWEIWDVYVGDAYSEANQSHGVYFKANFAGDGSARPTGSQEWSIDVTFNVGEQAFARRITHDGTDVTTDFEGFEWQIADGNVFQVRAWAPVASWEGLSVTDIVLVSSVDGEPRDTAPGGIHLPGSGTEVPVEAPATPIFPALGEGRIVDAVPLTGPAKFLTTIILDRSNGTFDFVVENPLQEQGQHVMLRASSPSAWTVTPEDPGASLDGGDTATLTATFTPASSDGSVVEPLLLDILTDIGGRQTYYVFIDADGQVSLTDNEDAARPAPFGQAPAKDTTGFALAPLVAALAVAVAVRTTGGRRD